MIKHDNKTRQVFAFSAKAVGQPGAHAGPTRKDRTAVHLEDRWPMVVALAVHATNDTKFVSVFCQLWIGFRDVDARLPVFGKFVGAFHGNVFRLATHKNIILLEDGNRLTIIFRQSRLRIEEINVAWTAVHEKEDDRFNFSGVMGSRCGKRVRRAIRSVRILVKKAGESQ